MSRVHQGTGWHERRQISGVLFTSNTVTDSKLITPGGSAQVVDFLEIADGAVLEIGAEAVVEIA